MTENSMFFYNYFPLFLTAFIILAAIAYNWIIKVRDKKNFVPGVITPRDYVFTEETVKTASGHYYDKTHTWAFMEKDGNIKFGIDDFLQHVTGPITGVKMLDPGERVRKGQKILSIVQNGKQLDIYSAVSGTIKEKNSILKRNSALINSSPYIDGWVYRIEPSNWPMETQFLSMGNKYKEWLSTEFTRLKDFLTSALKSENLQYAHIMQDGGELKDGILEDFGPEVWEDFQTNFIDVLS